MTKKTTDLILKSNSINAYTFYKTPTELKIFSKLIIEIRADKKNEKSVFRVWVKELMEWVKFKNLDYSKIKEIASNMFWKITTKYDNWFIFDVIFTRININNAWYIDFKINEDIRPHITNLTKEFTGYFLENIADLKSYYSIRIYELLKQFESTWKWYVTIEKLKENLKITPKEYKMYWHLKDRVIKTAQKELKEKTDINFTFEEHKTGKKIDRLTFFIWKNIKTKISSEEKKKAILAPLKTTKKETKEQAEIRKLWTEKLKLDTKSINDILKNYQGGEKQVLDNIIFTVKKFEQGEIKKSVGGFLISAIKHNYAKQSPIFDIKEDKKKQALQEEKNKLAADQLLKNFSTYKSHKIEDYKNKNSKELKFLVPYFIDKNKKILELNKINSENIEEVEIAIENHKFVKINFNSFIADNYLKNEILTFEEWAKNQNINN